MSSHLDEIWHLDKPAGQHTPLTLQSLRPLTRSLTHTHTHTHEPIFPARSRRMRELHPQAPRDEAKVLDDTTILAPAPPAGFRQRETSASHKARLAPPVFRDRCFHRPSIFSPLSPLVSEAWGSGKSQPRERGKGACARLLARDRR